MEANRENGKDLENVTTAASQDIGQENAQKQKDFSLHATTVVRKATKHHSVRFPKGEAKEKASVKLAMKAIGLGKQVQK